MLPASGFHRALSEVAPALSRRFFTCSSRTQCGLWTEVQTTHEIQRLAHLGRRQFGTSRSATVKPEYNTVRPGPNPATLLRSQQSTKTQSKLARTFSTSVRSRSAATTIEAIEDVARSEAGKGSSFPKTSTNTVAYWLLGSAASVFGIVVFGGLTRLTESGLSITEWKPVTGSLPPRSQEDWEAEFSKYRSSPEFKLLNSRMTLEEFKSIYWMEWIHRLWGRFVGLSFVVPAVYLVAKRKVSKPMAWRLFGIAGLIGFQGFIGWWMVKSGLKDDLFAAGSHPRVSQYRLTAHLGAAFICYVAMLWNGLSILRTNKLLSQPAATSSSILAQLRNPALKTFKLSVGGLAALVFITAMSGGLVAGLDAGLIYNEFPYMGLGLTPPKSELFDKFYSHTEDHSDLVWRNFLENPSLVQLDHRILATTTFSTTMAMWAWTRYSPQLKAALPRAAAKGMHGVVGFVWLQVILGITTLIYLVPTHLASTHQAGSLALLTWTFVLGSRVWLPSAAVQKIVAERMRAAVAAGGKTRAATSAAGASSTVLQGTANGSTTAHVASGLAASGAGLVPLGLWIVSNSEKVKQQELDSIGKAQVEFLQRQSSAKDV